MKIGIDARLALHEPHGMGKYVLHLVRELAQIDRANTYILYTDRDDRDGVLPKQFQVRVLPSANYFIWEQILLPQAVRRDRLDLLHCPANTAPLRVPKGVALVMTIHDVMYLHRKNDVLEPGSWYQRAGAFYRRQIVPRAAAQASAIMTDSGFSKEEIHQLMPVGSVPVEVVHLGCEFLTAPDADVEALRTRHGIAATYILSFGGIAPRKNTRGLLRVHARLHERIPVQLVVTSVPRSAQPAFLEYARELGIDQSVLFLDFLPEEDLHTLLSHAGLFLYLTKFEGFGLPVVEAMKCGTPIVTTNVTSIPEIAGDAAVLVLPEDEEGAAEAAERILRDTELRRSLVVRGLERSSCFSWAATARQVLDCYQRAGKEGVR